MPSLGDFFRINASPGFVEPWDIWLQIGMQEVRRLLGSNWEVCFMSAPIWRFTLSAGLAGPDAMLGVLMPSMDRVGREFPLTLMTPVSGTPLLTDLHSGAESLFPFLEDIALNTLDDDMTRDKLVNLLSQLSLNHVETMKIPGLPSSIWTALLDNKPVTMTCKGLPNAVQMRGLFDPNAPLWYVGPKITEVNP